jgi:hypothetical protein
VKEKLEYLLLSLFFSLTDLPIVSSSLAGTHPRRLIDRVRAGSVVATQKTTPRRWKRRTISQMTRMITTM